MRVQPAGQIAGKRPRFSFCECFTSRSLSEICPLGGSPLQNRQALQRESEPKERRRESLAIESGKSLPLMLEQYADCLPPEYTRQWRTRQRYNAKNKKKRAAIFFFLCLRISPHGEERASPTVLLPPWQTRVARSLILGGFAHRVDTRCSPHRSTTKFNLTIILPVASA